MALRGKESVGLSSAAAALLTLFLFSAFFFSVASSTTSTFGMCFSELQACRGDAECANCIFDWGSANYDSSECAAYTVVASSTTSTSCESDGVRNCCFFEDGTANTCMQNSLMIDYWSCIMESNGCLLDDMPCYGTTTSSTSAELDISFADDTYGSTRKTLSALASVLVTTVAALGLAV